MYKTLEDFVGNTPLVKLQRLPGKANEKSGNVILAKLEGDNGSDEDVLTYAMFPSVAPGFFKTRDEGPKNVGKTPEQMAEEKTAASGASKAVIGPITYKVSLGGRDHSVTVERA